MPLARGTMSPAGSAGTATACLWSTKLTRSLVSGHNSQGFLHFWQLQFGQVRAGLEQLWMWEETFVHHASPMCTGERLAKPAWNSQQPMR